MINHHRRWIAPFQDFAAVFPQRCARVLSSNNEVRRALDRWREKGRKEHSGGKCVRDERKKNSRGEVEIASETGTPLIHHCKAVFRGRADILFTFIPTFRSRWGSEDVVELGMERGGGACIYRGESSGERWIYPDTEIFASMLSTITHRTSSTEGRAIFQATAGGYVYRVTCMHPYTRSRGLHVHGQTPKEKTNPRARIWRDCSRACKRDTDGSNFRGIRHVLVSSFPLYACTPTCNQIVSRRWRRAARPWTPIRAPRKWKDDA